MPVHERLLRTNPDYMRARAASENHALEFTRMRGLVARPGVTVIPVVVHVVYNAQHPEQNISDAQVNSQIDVLNHDYRIRNADVSTTPSVFAPLAADARVEFALATTDPQGNPTTGITRTSTNVAAFADDDGVKAAASGGVDPWPADKYLNIWVCQLGGGLLGYAQFPGGPAATDGVVILHSAFGTSGTAAAPFNLGRTATHEIGHWINLRHIWGDDGTGCSGSDYVDDTPNQGGPNYGVPVFPHITCSNGPNGDLFMNYMDYVDDAAMVLFTTGQVTRMQATLDSDRSSIGTTRPEPTLAKDDLATLKFRDDHPTVASLDLGTLKFRDDHPTLATLDLTTLKFRDDLVTLKFIDDGGTAPAIDQVKQPYYDKAPSQDYGKPPGADLPQIPTPGGMPPAGLRGGFAAPFVLATPHHSMAWARSFPSAAQAAVAEHEAQLAQYQQALSAYAQADQAGTLSATDRVAADALYQEYLALLEEYRQLVGG